MLGHAREHSGIRSAWVGRLMVILALTAAIATWLWIEGAEERALSDLPVSERRSIYARELENLRALCAPLVSGDLSKRCRERAAFVLEFPECDSSCQEIARPLQSVR